MGWSTLSYGFGVGHCGGPKLVIVWGRLWGCQCVVVLSLIIAVCLQLAVQSATAELDGQQEGSDVQFVVHGAVQIVHRQRGLYRDGPRSPSTHRYVAGPLSTGRKWVATDVLCACPVFVGLMCCLQEDSLPAYIVMKSVCILWMNCCCLCQYGWFVFRSHILFCAPRHITRQSNIDSVHLTDSFM